MSTLTPPRPFHEWLDENREDLRDEWREDGEFEDGWEGFEAWCKVKYDDEVLLYQKLINL